MRIIKDRQIVNDDWIYIDDGALMPGNITVSLQRWQADKEQLMQHSGKLGIRLTAEDPLEDIATDLSRFNLVEIYFKVFTDGRSFSQARLLRNRYHFAGEIRAVGHFMRDQIYYLHRVGVNSFKLDDDNELQGALSCIKDFSVNYQISSC